MSRRHQSLLHAMGNKLDSLIAAMKGQYNKHIYPEKYTMFFNFKTQKYRLLYENARTMSCHYFASVMHLIKQCVIVFKVLRLKHFCVSF